MVEPERCVTQTGLEQTCVAPSTRGWWARGAKNPCAGGGFCCSVCVGGGRVFDPGTPCCQKLAGTWEVSTHNDPAPKFFENWKRPVDAAALPLTRAPRPTRPLAPPRQHPAPTRMVFQRGIYYRIGNDYVNDYLLSDKATNFAAPFFSRVFTERQSRTSRRASHPACGR